MTKLLKVIPLSVMFLIGISSLISCLQDERTIEDLQTKDQIEGNINSGNWIITKFIDSGKDELNHFNGYNFIVNGNGGTDNLTFEKN